MAAEEHGGISSSGFEVPTVRLNPAAVRALTHSECRRPVSATEKLRTLCEP
jgi:hypothetical protein